MVHQLSTNGQLLYSLIQLHLLSTCYIKALLWVQGMWPVNKTKFQPLRNSTFYLGEVHNKHANHSVSALVKCHGGSQKVTPQGGDYLR